MSLLHNVILHDGPGDGMLLDMGEGIQRLVWDSPWREYEPGEYRPTGETDGPYAVWGWNASQDRITARLQRMAAGYFG